MSVSGTKDQMTETINLKQKIKTLENKLEQSHKQVEFLNQILFNLPSSAFWVDKEGRYQGLNRNCLKLLDKTSAKEVIGKTSHDFLNKDYANNITSIHKEILTTGKAVTIEEAGFSPDGKMATYLTQRVPLFDEDGNIKSIIGLSHNITAIKQTEKTIKYTKEIAEEANKAKSNFIANLSHDIRTPFSSIIGAAELLAFRETDFGKKELLNSIVGSSNSLLRLLNQMLEYSEFESEFESKKREFILLYKLTDQVKQLFSHDITHKSLSLDIAIADDIAEGIFGNRNAIERVLTNLISNAIKYTDEGHIKLRVQMDKSVNTRVSLDFIVQDTGIGIPEEKLPFIFEKFYKVSNRQTDDKPSNGLGLYIVKQLINQLGGEIKVESTVGKGSKFTATIPFVVHSTTS